MNSYNSVGLEWRHSWQALQVRQVAGEPPATKLDHRVKSRFLILAFKAFLILFSTILCDWVYISIALTTNRNKEYRALFFRNYANVQTYSSSLASVPTHQDIFSVLTSSWQCLPLLNFYYMRITGSDFWESEWNGNETTFPRSAVIRLGTTGSSTKRVYTWMSRGIFCGKFSTRKEGSVHTLSSSRLNLG